jgi:hypothetical protein
MDDHEHVQCTFTLFPRLVLAELFTDDLSGGDVFKNFQADLVTHLVIEIQMA